MGVNFIRVRSDVAFRAAPVIKRYVSNRNLNGI